MEVKSRNSGTGGMRQTDIISFLQSHLTGSSPSWLFCISDEESQLSNLPLNTCFDISVTSVETYS